MKKLKTLVAICLLLFAAGSAFCAGKEKKTPKDFFNNVKDKVTEKINKTAQKDRGETVEIKNFDELNDFIDKIKSKSKEKHAVLRVPKSKLLNAYKDSNGQPYETRFENFKLSSDSYEFSFPSDISCELLDYLLFRSKDVINDKDVYIVNYISGDLRGIFNFAPDNLSWERLKSNEDEFVTISFFGIMDNVYSGFYEKTIKVTDMTGISDLETAKSWSDEKEKKLCENAGHGSITFAQLDEQMIRNRMASFGKFSDAQIEKQKSENEKNGFGAYCDAQLEAQKRENEFNHYGKLTNAEADREREENKKLGKGNFTNQELIDIQENENAGLGSYTYLELKQQRIKNSAEGLGDLADSEVKKERQKNEKAGFGSYTDSQLRKQRKDNSSKGYGEISDFEVKKERAANEKAGKGKYTNAELKKAEEEKKRLAERKKKINDIRQGKVKPYRCLAGSDNYLVIMDCVDGSEALIFSFSFGSNLPLPMNTASDKIATKSGLQRIRGKFESGRAQIYYINLVKEDASDLESDMTIITSWYELMDYVDGRR